MSNNVANFSRYQKRKQIKENLVDVRDFNSDEDNYILDIKVNLFLFLNNLVLNEKVDIDYEKISEDELYNLKQMLVSRISIERLIKISYILGYKIDLYSSKKTY